MHQAARAFSPHAAQGLLGSPPAPCCKIPTVPSRSQQDRHSWLDRLATWSGRALPSTACARAPGARPPLPQDQVSPPCALRGPAPCPAPPPVSAVAGWCQAGEAAGWGTRRPEACTLVPPPGTLSLRPSGASSARQEAWTGSGTEFFSLYSSWPTQGNPAANFPSAAPSTLEGPPQASPAAPRPTSSRTHLSLLHPLAPSPPACRRHLAATQRPLGG